MKTESIVRKQTDLVADSPASQLGGDAVAAISANLRQLLADVFALYLKTKNFHWHMTGRHFRDYHLLLDEQGEQIFSIPTTSPSALANSAEVRFDLSATSPATSG